VNPVVETRFIVQRELRKSFRSIKGIILTLLTIAGGGGLALLFAQSDDIRQKRLHEKEISPEMLLEAKRKLFGWWFMDQPTGDHVGSAPGLLFFLFAVSLVLMPAVVLILGFDSVSAERQHKTVRYWTIRSRRASYIIGKWIGLWVTCGVVALGMHMLIWIVCTARGEASFAQIVSWGFRFWLASMPILGMWCAVSVFISSLLRIPILALLTTAAIFFGHPLHLPQLLRSLHALSADWSVLDGSRGVLRLRSRNACCIERSLRQEGRVNRHVDRSA
jgi:ABC-type transport system involved in multi-copper enzyme maturation permease subunit